MVAHGVDISELSTTELRRKIRVPGSPEQTAAVGYFDDEGAFQSELSALVVDVTPFSGAGLALISHQTLETGRVYAVRVGTNPPVRAQLVWLKSLDQQITRTGFEYLEHA